MALDAFITIECVARACRVELAVNDLPVGRFGADWGDHLECHLHEFLLAGRNEISLVIQPGDTPAEWLGVPGNRRPRSPAPPEAMARAVVKRYPPGVVAGPDRGETLVAVEWTGNEQQPVCWPQVHGVTVAITPPFPTEWSFVHGDRLDDTETVREECLEWLGLTHQALKAEVLEDYAAKVAARCLDYDRAYGKNEGSWLKKLIYTMECDMSMSWWAMLPLEKTQPSPRLVGRDRVMDVPAEDWQPWLRTHPNQQGHPSCYPTACAVVNEDWAIVR